MSSSMGSQGRGTGWTIPGEGVYQVHSAALYSTAQYKTVLCRTVLYTVQYSTIQLNTLFPSSVMMERSTLPTHPDCMTYSTIALPTVPLQHYKQTKSRDTIQTHGDVVFTLH